MTTLKLKTTLLLLCIISAMLFSCGDDEVNVQGPITLTTTSGDQISMDGIWISDCVMTNQELILKETMTFDKGNLRIDINEHETLDCNGSPTASELIQINFLVSGTTQVTFNDEELTVNRIDGTANYDDGRSETFKQVFLIDDFGNDLQLYHGLFGDDGGQVDSNGYPKDIIPLSLVKSN